MKPLLIADVNGGGGGSPDWTATLPDDIKPIVTTKGWKEPAAAVRSYVELEKTLGTKRLEAPQPNWDDKKWGEFWTAAGRPETADKYATPEVTLPAGVSVDETMLKSGKESFHKLGLTSNQAKGVLDFYYDFLGKSATAALAARTKEMEDGTVKLKADWGDKFDANTALVKKAYGKFATPELEKYLIDTGLGNHPDLIKAFANIGKAMLEDSAGGKGAGAINPQDVESAKVEINRLKTDEPFQKALREAMHPGHKEAVEKLYELNKRANPPKAVVS